MKTHLWIGSAAWGVFLVMPQGCYRPQPQPAPPPPPPALNRSITYLTTNGDPIAATEKGQVLEWRMAPTTVKAAFEVTFVGADPCLPHGALKGDNTTVASCVVTVDPKGTHYVPYRYAVNITLPDTDGRKISPSNTPWQVVKCLNCGSIGGPVMGPTAHGVQFTPGKGVDVMLPAPNATDGLIKVSCVRNSVTVDQPEAHIPAGASFQWEVENGSDWIATFAAKSMPCANGKTFTSVSGAGNQDTCLVSINQAQGSYPYTLHVNGCTNDANVTVVIDAKVAPK